MLPSYRAQVEFIQTQLDKGQDEEYWNRKQKDLLNRKEWMITNIKRAFADNYTYCPYVFIFDFELANWQAGKSTWINTHLTTETPTIYILKLIQETNRPKGWYLHDENLVSLSGNYPYLLRWYRSGDLIGLIFNPNSHLPKFDHQVRKWNSKWLKALAKTF